MMSYLLRMILFGMMALAFSMTNSHALSAGELQEFCTETAPLQKQAFCLGYLTGAHESMTVTQYINGVGELCMKVEKDGRSGVELKAAFEAFLAALPDQKTQTARSAVATAYAFVFPCGR